MSPVSIKSKASMKSVIGIQKSNKSCRLCNSNFIDMDSVFVPSCSGGRKHMIHYDCYELHKPKNCTYCGERIYRNLSFTKQIDNIFNTGKG